MVFNLSGLDKYDSKHTGSQTNVQSIIGGTYKQIRTDVVYIQEGTDIVYIWEGKDMIRQIYDNSMFEWPKISLVRTNFIISKASWYEGTKTKILEVN